MANPLARSKPVSESFVQDIARRIAQQVVDSNMTTLADSLDARIMALEPEPPPPEPLDPERRLELLKRDAKRAVRKEEIARQGTADPLHLAQARARHWADIDEMIHPEEVQAVIVGVRDLDWPVWPNRTARDLLAARSWL